jgi:tetratricopeptide (TPR) repeat protein
MFCLLPRWGGSYAAMDAFADEAQEYAEENPRLEHLLGYAAWDRADVALYQEKDPVAARGYIRSALIHGDEYDFYDILSEIEMREDHWREALDDVDRALELAPALPDLLVNRAYVLDALNRRGAASADVELVVRLDPTNTRLPNFRRKDAEKAVLAGYEHAKQKRWDAAIERYTWAHQLAPGETDALYWRGRAHLERKETAAALADFEEAVKLDPHHVESIRNIDYILASRGDWPTIIGHWDRLIALEPDNAEAYLERGGAYHHKGDAAEALADARKACDLGLAKACNIAQRHGG